MTLSGRIASAKQTNVPAPANTAKGSGSCRVQANGSAFVQHDCVERQAPPRSKQKQRLHPQSGPCPSSKMMFISSQFVPAHAEPGGSAPRRCLALLNLHATPDNEPQVNLRLRPPWSVFQSESSVSIFARHNAFLLLLSHSVSPSSSLLLSHSDDRPSAARSAGMPSFWCRARSLVVLFGGSVVRPWALMTAWAVVPVGIVTCGVVLGARGHGTDLCANVGQRSTRCWTLGVWGVGTSGQRGEECVGRDRLLGVQPTRCYVGSCRLDRVSHLFEQAVLVGVVTCPMGMFPGVLGGSTHVAAFPRQTWNQRDDNHAGRSDRIASSLWCRRGGPGTKEMTCRAEWTGLHHLFSWATETFRHRTQRDDNSCRVRVDRAASLVSRGGPGRSGTGESGLAVGESSVISLTPPLHPY